MKFGGCVFVCDLQHFISQVMRLLSEYSPVKWISGPNNFDFVTFCNVPAQPPEEFCWYFNGELYPSVALCIVLFFCLKLFHEVQ